MCYIFVWRVVWAKFLVFVFTYLNMHVSTDDKNVVFGNSAEKGRLLIVDGDEVHFIYGIGGILAGDACCAGVTVKCSYHRSWPYFLDAIKWF